MGSNESVQKTTLMTVMTTSFMVTFMGSSINLALPDMGREFGSSAVMASWVVTSYLLTSAVFLLPWGRLADIRGRRTIYLWGTALYSLFTLATTLAHNMHFLLVYRVFQGISAAMIFSTGRMMYLGILESSRQKNAKYCCLIWIGSKDKKLSRSRF